MMTRPLLILTLAALVALAGCQSDADQSQTVKVDRQISDLEMQLAAEDTPDPKQLKKLLELYEKHVDQYPERREVNANLLLRAADVALQLGRPKKAVALYDRLLTEFRGTSVESKALYLKTILYDKELQRPDSVLILGQTFLWRYRNDPFANDMQVLLDSVAARHPDVAQKVREKQASQTIMGGCTQQKTKDPNQ